MSEPLDPQIQLLLDNLPGGLALRLGDEPAKAREQFRRITVALREQQPAADLASTEDIEAPGASGALPARVYRPHSSAATLLFFHGGGFILGDVESYDLQARTIAERTGMTVVSAEYRLAPENPYPAAADDAESITRWAIENARSLGGDPARVIVGGDSAGGNLAAGCAQRVPGIAGQLLVYPVTDFAGSTPSMTEHAGGPLLSAEAGAAAHAAYVGSADPEDPRISPLRAEEFAELPPAVVVTCEYDILRDGGIAYAEKLREHDVPVTHLHYPALMHGFMGFFPLSAGCDSALSEICAATDALLI